MDMRGETWIEKKQADLSTLGLVAFHTLIILFYQNVGK